jgi:predicted O-methyltransferase YrrM
MEYELGEPAKIILKELTDRGHLDKDNLPKIWIETGTYKGHSTKSFAEVFDHVYTIEIKPELTEEAKEYCKDFDNITYLNGPSPTVLNELLPTLKETYAIFLDAHHSGGDTGLDEKYGAHGTPLEEELAIIGKYSKDGLIVIDDCVDLGSYNYPTPQKLETVMKGINGNYKVEFMEILRRIGVCYT